LLKQFGILVQIWVNIYSKQECTNKAHSTTSTKPQELKQEGEHIHLLQ